MQDPKSSPSEHDQGSTKWKKAREKLRSDNAYKFVTPQEFGALAVSNADLVRCDLTEAHLKGLRDVAGGICYVVEVERLPTDRTW